MQPLQRLARALLLERGLEQQAHAAQLALVRGAVARFASAEVVTALACWRRHLSSLPLLRCSVSRLVTLQLGPSLQGDASVNPNRPAPDEKMPGFT